MNEVAPIGLEGANCHAVERARWQEMVGGLQELRTVTNLQEARNGGLQLQESKLC